MAAYTDNSPMPFGKFKGTKLANVPSYYLLWIFNNTPRQNLDLGLREYIKQNMDILQQEVNDQNDGN